MLDYHSAVRSMGSLAPYKKDIKLLDRVQRQTTKLLPQLTHNSDSKHIKVCNLPTLHYTHIRDDMLRYIRL